MNSFLENIAFRQFENKLPERYEEEPVCCCKNCGGEMYELEDGFKLNGDFYCEFCVSPVTVTQGDFDS